MLFLNILLGGRSESYCSPLKEPVKCWKDGKMETISLTHPKTSVWVAEGHRSAIISQNGRWECSSPARKWFGSQKTNSWTSSVISPHSTCVTLYSKTSCAVISLPTVMGFPLESTHCVVFVTNYPRAIALSKSSSNFHAHDVIPYKKSSKMQRYYPQGRNPNKSAERWQLWPRNPGRIIRDPVFKAIKLWDQQNFNY